MSNRNFQLLQKAVETWSAYNNKCLDAFLTDRDKYNRMVPFRRLLEQQIQERRIAFEKQTVGSLTNQEILQEMEGDL